LAGLAGGDQRGCGIMKVVEWFAGIRLGPGTLYGAIGRLKERGMIRAIESI
jgi:DNA-binding PadR family transcriptional regulator